MSLINKDIPISIVDMIKFFRKYSHIMNNNWELIINHDSITGAYIYSRVLAKENVFNFIRNHTYFSVNDSNHTLLNTIQSIQDENIIYSIAICILTQRIKLIINVSDGNIEHYLPFFDNGFLEGINKFGNTSHKIWMICIDFSFRQPGYKIYWKIDNMKPFLSLIPANHRNYLQHILIKQDLSKILEGRNSKIYFKYTGLPDDNFFENKFPLICKTGILKPNYYAIQPQNKEESLYYSLLD